jgi:hypothetical protein
VVWTAVFGGGVASSFVNNVVCITSRDRESYRVYRDNHRREQARLDGLVNGEEYFVVLATPGDPGSFVGIGNQALYSELV